MSDTASNEAPTGAPSPFTIRRIPKTREFKVFRAGKPYSATGLSWEQAIGQARSAELAGGFKVKRRLRAPPIKYVRKGDAPENLIAAAGHALGVKGMTRAKVAKYLVDNFAGTTRDAAHIATALAVARRRADKSAGQAVPTAVKTGPKAVKGTGAKKPAPVKSKYVEDEAEEAEDEQEDQEEEDEEPEEEAE